MYIKGIVFKREEDSEWEEGYYVGEYENCENSIILDERFQPAVDSNNMVLDYKPNIRKPLTINFR